MSRYVTVASVSHSPSADREELLTQAARYVHRARRMGADIVVFPEVYPHLHAPIEQWPEVAEEIPGCTCRRMMEVAAAGSTGEGTSLDATARCSRPSARWRPASGPAERPP